MTVAPLPTEHDFDPWGGQLDAQSAWKNFGGLTRDQALAKFRENPWGYQENFMWMGGQAFAYYFKVLEEFVASIPDHVTGDGVVSGLGSCIQFQFHDETTPAVKDLAPRVLALVEFVLTNISRFGLDDDERRETIERWCKLARRVEATTR